MNISTLNWIFKLVIAATICLSFMRGQLVLAQGEDFDGQSLEDLLNIKTKVASRTEATPRASAGSVTIITAAEIAASGARDMMDVLLMVPGVSFGNDGFSAASIGIRGMWANEGKVLLLYDGLEMNEILFSTVQFGNRYPVDKIKRVEVIRGPGSAVYGGFAELAVINIISKSGQDLQGCEVTGTYGQMTHTWARRNMSAACGTKAKDFDVSVAAFSGQGRRSDRKFTGFSGETTDDDPSNDVNTTTQTYRFTGNRIDPMFINVGVSNERMRFRYIREFYEMQTTTGFGYLSARRPVYSQFYGQYYGLEVDFNLSSKLKFTPFVQYKTQKPWQTVDVEIADEVVSNFTSDRLRSGFTTSVDVHPHFNLLMGYTRQEDRGLNENFQSYQATFSDGSSRASYFTDSVLAQGVLSSSGGTSLTVGTRYDKHETVRGAFSPRVALGRTVADWHVKAMAAKAFRAPTIMNLDSNPKLKPDRTTTYEWEGGVRPSKTTYLTLNLFQTEILDPIIYGVDPTGATKNFNAERTGTYGGDLEFRVKDTFGFATLTYSYYRADWKNPYVYRVDGHEEVLLGFPTHKLSLKSSFNLPIPDLKFNPSATYLSRYFAYSWDDTNKTRYFEQIAPGPMVNLYFVYADVFTKGLDLGAGVFNVIDSDWRLAQPYRQGYHAPMPTPSREYVVRADYSLTF